MTKQTLEWQKARCPICGKYYEYVVAYKPKTCGNFSCIQAYLHPNIGKNEKVK